MKHLRLFIAVTIILSSIGTCAKPINQPTFDDETEIVTITGEIPNSAAFANVTAAVLYKNRSAVGIVDYSKENLQTIFIDWQQVNADKNGAYNFFINMKGQKPDDYILRISSDQIEIPYEQIFYYATLEDKQRMAHEIVDCVTASDEIKLQSLLDFKNENCNTAKLFNLTDERIFSVDKIGLSKVLFSQLKKNPVNADIPAEMANRILISACLQYLNEGSVENILDYTEIFGLDKTFVDTYKNKLANSLKTSFTKCFNSVFLEDSAAVNTVFCDSVAMLVLNNVQNWADINYIVENHGQYINERLISGFLDLDKYKKLVNKSKVGEKLGNVSFLNLSDFATRFNNLITQLYADENRTVSSGGEGGGGRRTSGISTDVSLPPVELDVIAPEKFEFDDLDDVIWAKESIQALLDKKIISGAGLKKFEPNRNILREEFVKMLMLAFNVPLSESIQSFTDVTESDWFYKYVCGAKVAKIISGNDDGSFGAGTPITREDMVVTAYRAACLSGMSFDKTINNRFADNDKISEYARDAVYASVNAKIISGIGNDLFAPQEDCTRAQAAKIICGLLEQRSVEK